MPHFRSNVSPSRHPLISWTFLWLGLSVGCEVRPAPESAGLDRDSAGIRLVEIPIDEGLVGVIPLSIDQAWMSALSQEFGDLMDVRLLQDGRTVLLERFEAKVFVVGKEGTMEASFGSEGEGPGEFNPEGLSVLVLLGSTVVVPDLFLQRLTEFDLSGNVLSTRAYPGTEGLYAVDWRRHPQGGLVFRALDQSGDQILRITDTGLDTIYSFPPLVESPNVLLSPIPLWDIRGDQLVTATTDTWSVRSSRSTTFETEWLARRDLGPLVLLDSECPALKELVVASAIRENGGVPLAPELRAQILTQISCTDRRPALAALRSAPNGDTWVQRALPLDQMGESVSRVASAEGYGGTDWDILDTEGFLTAKVRLPQGFRLTQIAEDWVIGIAVNDMGVQSPARLALPR